MKRIFTQRLILVVLVLTAAMRGMGQCTVFPSGLSALTVVSVSDTGVTFNWSGTLPNQSYNWTITNDPNYSGLLNPGFDYFSGSPTGTSDVDTTLQPGTHYWIYISNDQCNATDSISFTTAAWNCSAHTLQPGIIPPAPPCLSSPSFGMPSTSTYQRYTFLHNNQPIGGYVDLPGSSTTSVSYPVPSGQSAVGSYKVVTSFTNCPGGATDTGNTEYWYYAGIINLSVDSMAGTSAKFYWGTQKEGSTYQWGISTDSLTAPDSLTSTVDTFGVASGLVPGTKYYLYVTNPTIGGCEDIYDTASFVFTPTVVTPGCGFGNVHLSSVGDTTAVGAWGANVPGDTFNYVVTTDPNNTDPSKIVDQGKVKDTIIQVVHLSANTKYYLFVRDSTCGSGMDSVSFTTLSNPCANPPQPSLLDNEVSCLDGASFGMDVTYVTQSYTFLHANKPIGGYVDLPGSSSGGISYPVPADQQQYAGIYTVKTWVTGCTDTITLNPTTAYMGGVLNLTISALTDTSVAFHWQTAQAGSQYQWAIGMSPNGPPLGGFNPTTDTFAYARGFAPNTTYYIYVSNQTTCPQDNDTLSFTTLAGVVNPCLANPVPVPTIQSSTGSLTVCGGGALLLTSNVATGNYWALNGVLMDSTGASLAVTQSGNYTLIVKNAAGCSDTSAVAVVTLDPGPPVPVLTASGSTTICQGSSVTLNSSSDVGNQWYLNNGAMPGQNGIALVATQGGNYVVQVTDPAGCWAVSSPLTVTVNPIESGSTVTPAITPGGPLLLCTDTAVLLIASSAVNYQWFWDGDALPGENGDSLLVSISGAYSVATGTAGCGSVGSMSSPVQITYVDELVPAVAMQNGVLVSSYATGNQWYLNDSIIRGATHQQFTPQGPGSYTVRVEVGVQAIDTSTFQIGVGGCYSQYSLPYVIADSNLVTPQVLVYPNPMVDVLTLVNKRSGPVTVRIFSMMGQEMGLLANMGGGVTTVNVAGWSKGVYVVFVVDQGTQQTSKVVVVKL